MTSVILTYQTGYFIFNVQKLSLGVQELTMETACERNLYLLLLMCKSNSCFKNGKSHHISYVLQLINYELIFI